VSYFADEMGNICNPHDTVVDHKGKPEERKVPGETQTENPGENQVDHLEFGNSGKNDKLTSPRNIDQKILEQSQNKTFDTLKPVDEQKEILVSPCSQDSVQSSSSSTNLQDGAKTEKQQKLNENTGEEIMVVEHSIPQEENIVKVQNNTTSSDSKTQAEIKDIRRNDEVKTSCLKNDLIAEKKSAVEHNKSAVEKGNQATSSIGSKVDGDENERHSMQQTPEVEVHRLENEILEKRKVVDKQNVTLALLSNQKEERAKDLQNLEHRLATIQLQSELKRAFFVASTGEYEKSPKTVTLFEGRLFKFGRGGMTNPKEKWVQLRRYPKLQVILDYAELFFSQKFERNQIISVEKGERYLSGNGTMYRGRVFAVRTTSTGKHKYMVFAADNEGLCRNWIEVIKRALDKRQTNVISV